RQSLHRLYATGESLWHYSRQLVELSAQLPKVRGRSVLVHSLIHAYKLFGPINRAIDLKPCQSLHCSAFHSEAYLSALKRNSASPTIVRQFARVRHRFVSCAGQPWLRPRPCQLDSSTWPSTGLAVGNHAKRDEASGFCYINDIVYGTAFGVEEAATIGGDSDDIGAGPGRFASVNVPLKEGVSDAQFAASFAAVIDAPLKPSIPAPWCIFNLTLTLPGLREAAAAEAGRPLLLLGGGGYHFPSTAKLWTRHHRLAVGVDLDKDIPEHSFFSSTAGLLLRRDAVVETKFERFDRAATVGGIGGGEISNGLPRPCSCVRLSKYIHLSTHYTCMQPAAIPLPLSLFLFLPLASPPSP
uniref:Hist_deacetyl domain-containing protein n=1 Tax=Macrostomum lignano TaxID=282301 RepID=A0A1I8FQJ2_9PLAT